MEKQDEWKEDSMIRVGEGSYTSMSTMTIGEYYLVQHILQEMRQVTSKLVINGGQDGLTIRGHGERNGPPQPRGERGTLPMDTSRV